MIYHEPNSDDLLHDCVLADGILVPQDRPDAIPQFMPAVKSALGEQRQSKKRRAFDGNEFWQFFGGNQEPSRELANALVERRDAMDHVRSQQMLICKTGRNALQSIVASARKLERAAGKKRDSVTMEYPVAPANRPYQGIYNAPSYLCMVSGSLAIAMGLVIEICNGLIMLKMAGHLQDEAGFSRISFVSPYVLSVFTVVSTIVVLFGGLSRTLKIYLFTCLPVSLIALLCYAIKMGTDIEVPNAFDPVASLGMHWLLFFGIAAGAGIACSGKILWSVGSRTVFGTEYKKTSLYEFHEATHHRWFSQRIVAEEMLDYLSAIESEIESEREADIALCLAEWSSARDHIARQVEKATREVIASYSNPPDWFKAPVFNRSTAAHQPSANGHGKSKVK